MTKDEWDVRWRECFVRLRHAYPDASLEWAQRTALNITTARYEQRPSGPTALLLKAGLSILGGHMGLKFTVTTFIAALVAGASAFGVAWNLAATNATPGVQPGEYLSIAGAVLIALAGTFFHDNTPKV
jgi:hypothetical protein